MFPIRYEADYKDRPNRVTTFFRYFLAIPWVIVGSIYSIAAFVVALIAWFALLFTGRYPQGLYNFNAGFLRFTARVYGFFFLQTDAWPPFGFSPDPTYPVRLDIDPAQERYSRAKVFFRMILAIPTFVVGYFMGILARIASVLSWLTVVFRGYQPGGVHNAIATGVSYEVRSLGYALLLLSDRLPPVSDQGPAGTLPPGEEVPQLTRGGS
jgi:hypothetical protein